MPMGVTIRFVTIGLLLIAGLTTFGAGGILRHLIDSHCQEQYRAYEAKAKDFDAAIKSSRLHEICSEKNCLRPAITSGEFGTGRSDIPNLPYTGSRIYLYFCDLHSTPTSVSINRYEAIGTIGVAETQYWIQKKSKSPPGRPLPQISISCAG